MTFKELYDSAASRVNEQVVNKIVTTGTNMAIIESASGNVYYGVSVSAANGLGVSAERAALYNMITYGELEVSKVIVVDSDKNVVLPSGDSREFMLQLSEANAEAEVLIDGENLKIVRLNKLLPLWWGAKKY